VHRSLSSLLTLAVSTDCAIFACPLLAEKLAALACGGGPASRTHAWRPEARFDRATYNLLRDRTETTMQPAARPLMVCPSAGVAMRVLALS